MLIVSVSDYATKQEGNEQTKRTKNKNETTVRLSSSLLFFSWRWTIHRQKILPLRYQLLLLLLCFFFFSCVCCCIVLLCCAVLCSVVLWCGVLCCILSFARFGRFSDTRFSVTLLSTYSTSRCLVGWCVTVLFDFVGFVVFVRRIGCVGWVGLLQSTDRPNISPKIGRLQKWDGTVPFSVSFFLERNREKQKQRAGVASVVRVMLRTMPPRKTEMNAVDLSLSFSL